MFLPVSHRIRKMNLTSKSHVQSSIFTTHNTVASPAELMWNWENTSKRKKNCSDDVPRTAIVTLKGGSS